MALNVKQAKSDYVSTEAIYIYADGSITPPGAPVTTVDNVTYTLTDNIVDAAPTWNRAVIFLQRNNTVLDGAGYTLEVAESDYGIKFSGSNVTVKNVRIAAFVCGVHLNYASNCTVSHNDLTNGVVGIVLSYSSNNTICENNVTANRLAGIGISTSSNNNSVSGNNVTSNDWGIIIEVGSSDNIVSGNSISGNNYGISIKHDSERNIVYHNNFVNNTDSASAYLANVWDDGYPSGGNYWSDYETRYPDASEIDGSGIWDTPYVIDDNNQDNYPLMNPYSVPTPSVVTATVGIKPDPLNLRGRGEWVTAYIELPEGYGVNDIGISTILLNGTIPVDPEAPTAIGDYDNDGTPDLMVKLNRTAVSEYIFSKGIMTGNTTLTATGQLYDGTPFEGTCNIAVRMPGDINMDGKVDITDLIEAANAFGSYPGHPRWDPVADENEDGRINILDLIAMGRNFGRTYP